ncbi:hypothetical protein [Variovorax saccharolyticus]|uniref:hypothetical protein n=1 Tax=Variovorax saccharolyticus TaxID=3053516 RepID=UPI002578195B|nr:MULTISPECIES: hypothetical protein [unclassified Variovorax]MDM0021729.1 hypothetical protein [Variovorax sp. J22R187]MDM0028016.1 hypothetical protein [Variovorax sp. J31P216]
MTKDLYGTVAETAALLREGEKYRHERLRAADMISVSEAASLLNVDASTIATWISGGRCIGIAGPDGTLRIPRWQFEPSAWSAIQLVGRALGTQEPWLILVFLETPAAALDGLTPRVALERGTAIERVLAAAISDAH